LATDRETDEQMDTPVAWSRSRCRKRRLNKRGGGTFYFQLAPISKLITAENESNKSPNGKGPQRTAPDNGSNFLNIFRLS